MEIILLEKVENLGDLGDKVNVKSGFGRNFLLPSGRAIPATKENLAEFEARRSELEKQAAERMADAEERKVKIEELHMTIACKAGDEGRLFGSVGNIDIAEALTEHGIPLCRSEVRLPNGPFRVTGDYEVVIHLLTDVNATLHLAVIPE